jgi:hypothetical protein
MGRVNRAGNRLPILRREVNTINLPGDLPEAFEAALYAYKNGEEVEPVYFGDDDDESRWMLMDPKERLMLVLSGLRYSTAIMPDHICAELDLPQGSTYAQGIEKILRDEFDPEEYE